MAGDTQDIGAFVAELAAQTGWTGITVEGAPLRIPAKGIATEVDREHGLRAAAGVMGNSEEVARRHYVERTTLAPDVRKTLDAFFA